MAVTSSHVRNYSGKMGNIPLGSNIRNILLVIAGSGWGVKVKRGLQS